MTQGIPPGTPCTIVVVARDGSMRAAGQWLASERGQTGGTTVDSAALIDVDDVVAVTIRDANGTDLVSART